VTSSAIYPNGRAFDEPLRRLPWTLAGAALISALLLSEFGRIMSKPEPLPEPRPIEAQLIEIPPPEVPPPPKPEPVKISRPIAVPRPRPAPEKPQFIAPKETTTAPVPPQEQLPAQTRAPPPPSPAPPVNRSSPGDKGNTGAQAIDRPMPKIPDDLRDQAYSAVAMARFRIAADGTTTVELATPTQDPRLNRLLLDTLRKWRFFPAMRDGKPVASVQDIRIQLEVK
jgi:periplasmic protein TonB